MLGKNIAKMTLVGCAVFALGISSLHAAPPVGYNAGESWQDSLSTIKELNKGLTTPGGINDRLFNPATQDAEQFQTMDGQTKFSGSFLCQAKNEILKVSATPASNGEVNIKISYDVIGTGVLNSHLIIENVAGACSAGAIYDCKPSGSWLGCKYGILEFKNSNLVVSPNYESGEARPALGMEGCFCFSDACGGTSSTYMQNILHHIGQSVATQIGVVRRNLMISEPQYDAGSKSATWFAGDIADCDASSISDLTAQAGKMDLNYQDLRAAQEEGSPWDLVTKQLERTPTQFTCVQQAKVSSEMGIVKRKQHTDFGVGWDTDGSSKQCFWFMESGSCGSYFGEPRSWDGCIEQFEANKASICYSLWVSGGYFSTIVDVQNVRPRAPKGKTRDYGISCYGAGDAPDDAQLWEMDCVGTKYADRFVCSSSNKGKVGEVIHNDPYDPKAYDGCDEIRSVEDSCATLAAREDCRLVKEESDGALTISNGALTSARPQPSCRTIKGANESIVVCEPWWKRTRTYECQDQTDQFKKEEERVGHITQNIQLDGNKFLSSVGDLTFSRNGTSSQQVIDTQIQFEKMKRICAPSCVIQKSVPNYELIVPSGQGKIEADGSYHVPDLEASVVPSGQKTIIETADCSFANDLYTCPIPEGWEMRSQCACADGQEFIQAISALTVMNEVSKDFICSTGKESGVCGAEDEGQNVHPVVCGDFSNISGNFVEGENYWTCGPKLWIGKTISNQNHQVSVSANYNCEAKSPDLPEDDHFENNLGPLVPQGVWFDNGINWAKTEILNYLNTDPNELDKNQVCDCAGQANAIDICQESQSSTYICLSSSAKYSNYAECKTECKGSATFTPEKKLCVWKDGKQVNQGGGFDISYNLSLKPQNEKVFGDVELKLLPESNNFGGGAIGYCVNNTVNDTATWHTVPGSCAGSTYQKTFDFTYSIRENVYSVLYNYFNGATVDLGAGWVVYRPNVTIPGNQYDDKIKISSYTAYIAEGSHWSQMTINTASGAVSSNGVYVSFVNSTAEPHSKLSQRIAYQVLDLDGTYTFPNGMTIRRLVYTSNRYVHWLDNFAGMYIESDVREILYVSMPAYTCSTTGNVYDNYNTCASVCTKSELRCDSSGIVVGNATQCIKPSYQCSSTGTSYSDSVSCQNQCKTSQSDLNGLKPCFTVKDPITFSLFLKEKAAPHGFTLGLNKKDSPEKAVASKDYEEEELILGQCLGRYTTPFIKYDEPGTNAHFEFSQFDALAYQIAISRTELPHQNRVLPPYPAVYVGGTLATYKHDNGLVEEVDEAGNIIVRVDPDLTPEKIAEIEARQSTTSVTIDVNGNIELDAKSQQTLIPRAPMFLAKQVAKTSYVKDQTRAGTMNLLASNLVTYVNYYQCPQGEMNSNTSCNEVRPFGGVVDTIAGKRCIQYLCDDNATLEQTSSQYSGCGLTNDGLKVE